MDNDKLVIERSYNAPAEKIWKALTDIAQMRQWYFPELEDFKPEAGFETKFSVACDGEEFLHVWKVTEAIPMKKIAYEWRFEGYPGNSLLSFELFPDGEKTKLILTHSGLNSFQPEKFPAMSKSNFNEGWTHFVGALEEFVG